jgi:hypothetical protein
LNKGVKKSLNTALKFKGRNHNKEPKILQSELQKRKKKKRTAKRTCLSVRIHWGKGQVLGRKGQDEVRTSHLPRAQGRKLLKTTVLTSKRLRSQLEDDHISQR